MADSKAVPTERIAGLVKNLLDDELAEADKDWSYRKAASVLSFFDMDQIRPLEGEADNTTARQSLLPASNIVYGGRWTLRGDSRREALRRLETEDNIKQALAVNPERPDDPLQKTLEDYVFHRAQPLERQSRPDLLNTLQVSEWLNGLVQGVPAPAAVRQRLEIENLLSSFRFLVGDHFRGREAELNRLAEYVGVRESATLTEAFRRGIRKVFSFKERPPLVIYGPGGVGKSTLVAKFILDHVISQGSHSGSGESLTVKNNSQRFPFAYLDFDRPSIIAEEPITLLIEALRQLEIQFPESGVSLKRVRESWTGRIAGRTVRRRSSQVSSESAAARVDRRGLFLDEFAAEVKLLTLDEQPLLLVLDTFEEVQYRSRAFVLEVFYFLEALQKRIPTLRTVLSGRAPIKARGESKEGQKDEFETDDLPLTIFDLEVAQGFLMSHGIEDPELAKAIAAQVGGTPLTLKLAVEVVRREGAGTKGIRDLTVNSGLLRRLEEGAIQVQLFTRILEHIHDQKKVARLAHPGLVLRRITPQLILEVLAEPCGIEISNLEEATELFNELSKEVSLVSQAGDNALIHRPDLRRVMLGPLQNDKTKQEKVKQIHQKAVEYYTRFDDDVSRAEEIYHRLWLGIDRPVLNERWRDGLALGSAIEELPMKARAFLAARLNLEVDDAVWSEADLEDWEIHAGRRARDLLELGQPVAALTALRQRNERSSNSFLPAIEREALIIALTAMQSFFSVYSTSAVERGTMSRIYRAILSGLRGLNLSGETIISVREILGINRPGGVTDGATQR